MIDERKIYYCLLIGTNAESVGQYTSPIAVLAQVQQPTEAIIQQNVGFLPSYDRKITLDIKDIPNVNETTVWFIDVDPIRNTSQDFEYKVTRMGDVSPTTDKITIELEKSGEQSAQPITFEYNGETYRKAINYNHSTNTAIAPSNTFFPIDTSSNIWLGDKKYESTVIPKIKLVSKEYSSNTSILYTFEKVEEE